MSARHPTGRAVFQARTDELLASADPRLRLQGELARDVGFPFQTILNGCQERPLGMHQIMNAGIVCLANQTLFLIGSASLNFRLPLDVAKAAVTAQLAGHLERAFKQLDLTDPEQCEISGGDFDVMAHLKGTRP